jgi:hypothetical protein
MLLLVQAKAITDQLAVRGYKQEIGSEPATESEPTQYTCKASKKE